MEAMRLGFAVKLITVMIFASTLFRCVSAVNHTVGGLAGWDVNSNLQSWSNSITFKLGDNLVFKYGPLHDVLEVKRNDFMNCRTINPITSNTDGSLVVPLTSSGTRYFICGRSNHCTLGLKLRVPIQKLVQQSNAPSPSTSSSSDDNDDDSSSSPPSSQSIGGRKPPSRPSPPRSPGDSLPLAPPITVQAQAPNTKAASSSSPGNDGAGCFTLVLIALTTCVLLVSFAA